MKQYFILIGVLFLGCAGPDTHEKNQADSSSVTADINQIPIQKLQPDTTMYQIVISGIPVSLQQWDSTINLTQKLGKPTMQSTKQLDKNSDTHAGAFIKDLAYPGVQLKLYSPPQNGSAFWVQEIILTDSLYYTNRGITLGATLSQVQTAYPELKPFPGDNKNNYYVADAGYEKSIEMEFSGGKLSKLRMYYMIP